MATDKFELKGKKYVIKRDPNSVLDYKASFSSLLVPGDTITNAIVAAVSGGIAINSLSFTTTTVTLWVSGGTLWAVGQPYASATIRITTAGGRIDDRTVYFKVVHR